MAKRRKRSSGRSRGMFSGLLRSIFSVRGVVIMFVGAVAAFVVPQFGSTAMKVAQKINPKGGQS